MKKVFVFLIGLTTFGCIGTDVLDDVLVQEKITINEELVNLLVNTSTTLTAEYTDEFGVTGDTELSWASDDPSVAAIDNNGLLTGISAGQTFITVQAGSVTSTPLLVTVVESADDVAKVLIEAPKVGISVDEVLQLEATAWNVANEQIENAEDAVWSVNDSNIATVDAEGNLTGLSVGIVQVTASIDGVESEPLEVTVGTMERTAEFQGVSGYRAVGTATLSRNEQGDVILEFSEDFDTSFALGTFIYLSNSTDGSDTRNSGLDLGEIRSGGAKTFNVSSVDGSVELDTYRYVIVLCRPASLTFGVADFEE